MKDLTNAIFVQKLLPTNQICGHILKRTRTLNLSSAGIAGKHLPSNPTSTNMKRHLAINQNDEKPTEQNKNEFTLRSIYKRLVLKHSGIFEID